MIRGLGADLQEAGGEVCLFVSAEFWKIRSARGWNMWIGLWRVLCMFIDQAREHHFLLYQSLAQASGVRIQAFGLCKKVCNPRVRPRLKWQRAMTTVSCVHPNPSCQALKAEASLCSAALHSQGLCVPEPEGHSYGMTSAFALRMFLL